VLAVDRAWTIAYVNPAGAALLQRPVGELTGRNLWAAVPEVADSILHGFLLHGAAAAAAVSWTGFYPPAERWLTVTAGPVGGLLQVTLRAEAASGRTPGEGGPGEDADRFRFLAEVSEALIASLDTGETATRLAELATGRLCDWAVIALADDAGGVGDRAWAHRDPAMRGDLNTYLTGRRSDTGDDAAMIDALLTGQPVRVPMVHHEVVAPSLPTEAVRTAWRRLDTTSCTVVPLRARGETFGAVAMLNTGNRPAHTDAEIALAVEVARRGALALHNARLYGQQPAVAETLQRSLLTDPPQPDDLELRVRYQPASTHLHVGGDWHDVVLQPDGATVAVIGDVVGHDVDAAASMGQIRSMVRATAYGRSDSPAEVLTRVDTVLSGLHVGTLATALVARIEQPEAQRRQGLRTLRWSSAGHLPPLLLHPDGTVELLATAPERLLGTGTPCPRSDHTAQLHPGDTVLLYTDGLVEHGHTALDDGLARLTDALAELHHLPLEQLCDQLLERMLTCQADDDVALLAVRCHPQPAYQ
jgi:sigma-B regulation protein RsbU (phosphoserine phosphatase)